MWDLLLYNLHTHRFLLPASPDGLKSKRGRDFGQSLFADERDRLEKLLVTCASGDSAVPSPLGNSSWERTIFAPIAGESVF